ncbi:hypothetical protein CR513_20741, partial [Mucuna pruriens]
MKAFPFSLDGAAKDYLYLQLVLFNTWGDMKRIFLEKLFPVSKTASTKKYLLFLYFYKGLMLVDRSMINTASSGALMDKTPTVARNLISNVASNT